MRGDVAAGERIGSQNPGDIQAKPMRSESDTSASRCRTLSQITISQAPRGEDEAMDHVRNTVAYTCR